MNITWKVTSLQKQDIGNLKDVAVFASFIATATKGKHTASVSYSVNLLPPDAKTFVALSNLSPEEKQAMAVEWVKAAMAQPDKTDVAAELARKLAEQGPATTTETL